MALEHVIAAKAVAFGEAFQTYSQQVVVNASALAERLIERGIDVVSGGTDNHVVLLDLRSIGMTGKVADLLVSDVQITANKNTVPFDPESPFVTSGLRLGTAALTTRGFDADAFREVADVIADRLLNPDDDAMRARCLQRVAALLSVSCTTRAVSRYWCDCLSCQRINRPWIMTEILFRIVATHTIGVVSFPEFQ